MCIHGSVSATGNCRSASWCRCSRFVSRAVSCSEVSSVGCSPELCTARALQAGLRSITSISVKTDALVSAPHIAAEGWSVNYPGGSRVPHDLSFSVQPGSRVLLLGASGSGKSTLVSSIIGLVPHSTYAETDGDLFLCGNSILDSTPAALSRTAGVVFQDPDSQLTMLRVEDELAFGLENIGLPAEEMDRRIAESLHSAGLEAFRRERVDRLSGGLKQRLVIAAILAMRPQVLVFDEPTSNLDPRGVRDFVDLVARICAERKDLSVVIVEHRLDAIIALVDRVIVLDSDGRIALDGSPQHVFETNADQLAALNVWLPSRVSARRAQESGQLASWCAPRAARSGSAPADRPPPLPDRRALLECRDLCFSYRNGMPVLSSVSLELRSGEICALVGSNGSGKSTLAALAVGTLKPDSGTVLFDGRPVSSLPAREIRDTIGYVFQNPEHQFVTDRVIDELRFRLPGTEEEQNEAAIQVARTLRLEPYLQRNPFQLSHGQKRRLSVATMLIRPKRLLVLDEPTFGQDPSALHELMEMIHALAARDTSILIVTHDMDLVWRSADRVCGLADGRIVADAEPRVFFADAPLLESIGIEAPACAAYFRRLP
ncbi:MAG: ABC transporter ATP-binding protein [Spirochaetaceae bacterium]|nr:MAG: ABC transporter ATP-binding protein [Spirochaetaceae bacterium]